MIKLKLTSYTNWGTKCILNKEEKTRNRLKHEKEKKEKERKKEKINETLKDNIHEIFGDMNLQTSSYFC